MSAKTETDPISIAWARENCAAIAVHCLKCQNVTEIGFDRFRDEEKLIDLPKLYRFRCTRCNGTWVETRPVYPYRSSNRNFLGLEKKD